MVATDDVPTHPRAVIASGTGRYADPWHPHVETSEIIAELLRADGWDVEIAEPDTALSRLEGADLLVVNAGDPWRDTEARVGADPAATAGLDAALDRGIGLLAVHSALTSLRDYPRWREAVGGEWAPGHSWHPALDDAVFTVVDAQHPIAAGATTLEAEDERYCDLIVDAGSHTLVDHELDGTRHPVIWVREQPVRAVAWALGHDARSYASPSHRAMLTRAARWAAGA